jgi:hypothetical protein
MKTLADLDKEFEEKLSQTQQEHDWYKSHRWAYVWLSNVTRGIAAILLAFGVILPLAVTAEKISIGAMSFSGPAQLGVACIALAGLIIGANQVFLISSTWSRYVGAMMKLKTLQQIARVDWDMLKTKFSDPLTPDDIVTALAHFKSLVADTRQIVETETASWSSDLAKAMDQLKVMVQEQKSVVENLAKEERKALEAAQASGVLRLKLEGQKQRLTGEVTISAGSAKAIKPVADLLILADVPAGIQNILLVGTDANKNSIVVENAVQIAPNAITEFTLQIPIG